jgi:hypothetical protein
MVNIGDTCMVTGFFGSQLWVAMRQEADGRWRLSGKRTDQRGRDRFTSRTVGLGDIQVLVPAPTFAPGDEIERRGETCFVIEDRGSEIEIGRPESRSPTRGTEFIKIPAGNTCTLSKGEVVLSSNSDLVSTS